MVPKSSPPLENARSATADFGRRIVSSSVKPLTIGGVNMKTPGKDDSAKRFITIGGGKGGVGKSLGA